MLEQKLKEADLVLDSYLFEGELAMLDGSVNASSKKNCSFFARQYLYMHDPQLVPSSKPEIMIKSVFKDLPGRILSDFENFAVWDMRRCLEIWFKDLTVKVVQLTFEFAQRKLLPIWRIGENAADKGLQRYFGEGWFLVVR